jgi:2-hydroxy-3-keto-5-methylthiopentenyl-1-phosphate phosphatase
MIEWSILCDFDGTIAIEDITDTVLERYARHGWETLEHDWRAGRIGSRECMDGQIGLLDVSRSELDAHLDHMRIDPDFPAFAHDVAAAGIGLRIVSDGLDYAIRAILARHHLQDIPVHANQLVSDGERRWRLEFPYADLDCRSGSGMCKCAKLEKARARAPRVLLIGDGVSDYCAAERADFVFAKHRLLEHCRAADIPHVPIVGFADALHLLPALISGQLTADSNLASAIHANATVTHIASK